MPEEIEKEIGVEGELDEEVAIDPELLIGDDDATLDEEEIDPFKDKWEE